MYDAMATGMSNVFYGVITGTMTAREAFRGLGQSMLKVITDYLAKKLLAFLFEKALMASQVATAVASAAAIAAALIPIQAEIAAGWAVGAASASIATYGGAAVEGAAAYLTALGVAVAGAAAIQAGSAAAGAVAMQEGGPVTSGSGTKDDVPILAMRGEYMVKRRAVEYYGLRTLEAINRMIVPRSALASAPTFEISMPETRFQGGGVVTAPPQSDSAQDGGKDLNLTFYLDGEPFFNVIEKGLRDGRMKKFRLVPV
jgi:hypothetical protein